MAVNQYITRDQVQWILDDLNIKDFSELKKVDLIQRATGDLEADLAAKFVVPLRNVDNRPYATCPEFARNKVLNAMKEKIREIIGYDQNRNLMAAMDSTERFVNVHAIAYKAQMKSILDTMIVYGFQLLDQAKDSQSPVQRIGLSRANNKTDPYGDE